MAAEIPISLAEFHSLPYATADLLVIPCLFISHLRMIAFSLSSAEKYSKIDKLLIFYSTQRKVGNKNREKKN